jgi:uncharacterized protein
LIGFIMNSSRRDFLCLGLNLPLAYLLSGRFSNLFAQDKESIRISDTNKWEFKKLSFSFRDELTTAQGYRSDILIKRGDEISLSGERFGDCCDFTKFIPISKDSGFLWVNHEYIVASTLYNRRVKASDKTRAMVDLERSLVGGSCLLINYSNNKGWQVNAKSQRSFRLDAASKIPLVGPVDRGDVEGTFANCSGGLTPWGTILTCEENTNKFCSSSYGWSKYYRMKPDDYGWVVEVDLQTKKARKLTSLGRFEHEGACVVLSKNNHVVVYMGDDASSQCMYKFISKKPFIKNKDDHSELLVDGDLYVANFVEKKWEILNPANKKLYKHYSNKFSSLKNILLNTRSAAKVVGGTPLNRPEGIVKWKDLIMVALTNNTRKGDYYGQILAIKEADYDSLIFDYQTFVTGSKDAGFSCPDNLAVSNEQELWLCTDISGKYIGKGRYSSYPRNAFIKINASKDSKLDVAPFMLAPVEAELTGPCFHSDDKSLFISVQHPGEYSYKKGNKLTSNWPKGGSSLPLSSVVVVSKK